MMETRTPASPLYDATSGHTARFDLAVIIVIEDRQARLDRVAVLVCGPESGTYDALVCGNLGQTLFSLNNNSKSADGEGSHRSFD
jgi:hypothetical protein